MLFIRFYFAYIVECADGTFYSGSCINLSKRMKQHNGELRGGAKYTKVRRPVALKYYEKFSSHKGAAKREAMFKSLSHEQKYRLLQDVPDGTSLRRSSLQ